MSPVKFLEMLKDYAAACRALWHALSIPNNIYTFGPKATRRSEDCCRDHTFYFDPVESPRSYTNFSWSNLNLVRTNWGRFQCIAVCWITLEKDSQWKEARLQIYLICAAPLPRSVSLLAPVLRPPSLQRFLVEQYCKWERMSRIDHFCWNGWIPTCTSECWWWQTSLSPKYS